MIPFFNAVVQNPNYTQVKTLTTLEVSHRPKNKFGKIFRKDSLESKTGFDIYSIGFFLQSQNSGSLLFFFESFPLKTFDVFFVSFEKTPSSFFCSFFSWFVIFVNLLKLFFKKTFFLMKSQTKPRLFFVFWTFSYLRS